MKLIGSKTSPFTRITRIVCDELNLSYEFEETGPFGQLEDKHITMINTNNPLMKIPILVLKESVLIDSRVIISYLLKTYGKTSEFGANFPKSNHDENILTVIYGIIEAGVLRFIFTKTHPEVNSDQGYMVTSMERIETGLKWLNQQKSLGEDFGLTEAMLICCLEWFKKRSICDLKDFSHLNGIHDKYAERSSLVNTRIP